MLLWARKQPQQNRSRLCSDRKRSAPVDDDTLGRCYYTKLVLCSTFWFAGIWGILLCGFLNSDVALIGVSEDMVLEKLLLPKLHKKAEEKASAFLHFGANSAII